MADEGVRRLVASVPPESWARLDAMAESSRFGGNRSRAIAWCIEIAAVVLADAAVRDRLYDSPGDALAAYAAPRRRGGGV